MGPWDGRLFSSSHQAAAFFFFSVRGQCGKSSAQLDQNWGKFSWTSGMCIQPSNNFLDLGDFWNTTWGGCDYFSRIACWWLKWRSSTTSSVYHHCIIILSQHSSQHFITTFHFISFHHYQVIIFKFPHPAFWEKHELGKWFATSQCYWWFRNWRPAEILGCGSPLWFYSDPTTRTWTRSKEFWVTPKSRYTTAKHTWTGNDLPIIYNFPINPFLDSFFDQIDTYPVWHFFVFPNDKPKALLVW